MDPVKIEKLQAMRRYRSMQNRFLINLVQYCLSLLCFGLFLSSPLWLPKLCAALRHFVLVTIPSMGTYLFCPKCFFVLGNAIVIFLVGESKLSGAASTPDIYDEYMERRKTHRRTCPSVEKEKGAEVQWPDSEESIRKSDGLKEDEVKVDEEEEVAEEEEQEEEEEVVEGEEQEEEEEQEGEGEEGGYGWEEEDRGDECFDGEDGNALPADELNRRIEDFIARVNKQRRLELLDCSG